MNREGKKLYIYRLLISLCFLVTQVAFLNSHYCSFLCKVKPHEFIITYELDKRAHNFCVIIIATILIRAIVNNGKKSDEYM